MLLGRLLVFRFSLLVSIVVAVAPLAVADVHDVRIQLPAVSPPQVPQSVVKPVDIQDFELQHVIDRLPEAPSAFGWGCGITSMPHISFGTLTPIADLRYANTSSAFLSEILGRPAERLFAFRLKETPQTFELAPDASGGLVIHSLAVGRH